MNVNLVSRYNDSLGKRSINISKLNIFRINLNYMTMGLVQWFNTSITLSEFIIMKKLNTKLKGTVFEATILHCKAILGWGQPGLMRTTQYRVI